MNQPAAIEPAVEFLASLAGDGRALEFAIGTGRIGLPLRRRGVEVHGIELSRAMLEHLRRKEGGDTIPVTVGDMTTARADGAFRLVYLVYNTIMNVTTQAGQVAVFRNAAAHLEPGGAFVIEVGVPDLQRLPFGETFRVFDFSERHIGHRRVRRRQPGPDLAPLRRPRRRDPRARRGRSATSGPRSST